MKYQVTYGVEPVSKWCDTFQKARSFAVTHTLYPSPVIYEYADDGTAAVVWPKTSTEDHIVEKVNIKNRNEPITLREAINRARISQRKLSRDSGVSLTMIRNILSGMSRLSNVSVRNVLKLADVLQVDIRDLLDGEAERDL